MMVARKNCHLHVFFLSNSSVEHIGSGFDYYLIFHFAMRSASLFLSTYLPLAPCETLWCFKAMFGVHKHTVKYAMFNQKCCHFFGLVISF